MFLKQAESGLVVATENRPKRQKPPEHGARKDIREALASLKEALSKYEQTTHGHLFPRGVSLECVGKEIVTPYGDPTAYNIGHVSQYISAFIRQEESE